MSLITIDQPVNPKLFSALLLPNFTNRVRPPVEGCALVVEDVSATAADWDAEPPDPVHASVNTVLAVSAPVLSEPDAALAPDQPPEALQDVAFVELQVRVVALPEEMEVGVAVKLTLGGGVEGGVTEPGACL